MAINPNTNANMAGRITAVDANYPFASSKDETSPGAGDGTPYFKARADDIFGLQQALLNSAGIVPSGNADTVLIAQYVQAIVEIAAGRAVVYDDTGVADAYVLGVLSNQHAPQSYFEGLTVEFKADNANTGAATADVAGLGVKDIKTFNGTDPLAGDIPAGVWVTLKYDVTSGTLRLQRSVALQTVFTSAELTISSAGGIGPVAHGLGGAPELFQARVINKIAEQGYSVNDTVIINPAGGDPGTGGTTTDAGIALLVDSTNLAGFFGADSNPIRLFNKSTGVAFSATNANWRLIVKAWR